MRRRIEPDQNELIFSLILDLFSVPERNAANLFEVFPSNWPIKQAARL